jgi:origin recognition complex subunit 2
MGEGLLSENVEQARQLASLPSRIYIVVHNIDGQALRNTETQLLFSFLAEIPHVRLAAPPLALQRPRRDAVWLRLVQIRLVASIDHINAAFMWDIAKTCRFKWSWWNCTTYVPYSRESAYSSGGSCLSAPEQGNAATQVLKALNENAQSVFAILAMHSLENKVRISRPPECPASLAASLARAHARSLAQFQISLVVSLLFLQKSPGMPESDLYEKCREAFVCSNMAALHQHLTELTDHKLIRYRNSARTGGVQLLSVPLSLETLRKLLRNMEHLDVVSDEKFNAQGH